MTTMLVQRSKSKTESPEPTPENGLDSTPLGELTMRLSELPPASRRMGLMAANEPNESGSPIIFAVPKSCGLSRGSAKSLFASALME